MKTSILGRCTTDDHVINVHPYSTENYRYICQWFIAHGWIEIRPHTFRKDGGKWIVARVHIFHEGNNHNYTPLRDANTYKDIKCPMYGLF